MKVRLLTKSLRHVGTFEEIVGCPGRADQGFGGVLCELKQSLRSMTRSHCALGMELYLARAAIARGEQVIAD